MRTTVTLDDGLLADAQDYTGIKEKSALVNEIHRPVVARRGYFVAGKFDQFKRSVPYSAINDALRQLIRQILTEKNAWSQSARRRRKPELSSRKAFARAARRFPSHRLRPATTGYRC